MQSLRILLAVSALALTLACGTSSAPAAPTSPINNSNGSTAGVTIPAGAQSMGSSGYAPNPLTISVGTTVTWTNSDATPHTVTSDGNAFDSGSVAPSGKFAFTFQSAGTFKYHCTLHPGMVGSVVVQ